MLFTLSRRFADSMVHVANMELPLTKLRPQMAANIPMEQASRVNLGKTGMICSVIHELCEILLSELFA
jgi:hypothetical protein